MERKIVGFWLGFCILCAWFCGPQRSYAVENFENIRTHVLLSSKEVMELHNLEADMVLEGRQSLYRFLEICDNAHHRLGIVTFLWDADDVGFAQAYAAIQSAKRGVDTSVVIDGLQLRSLSKIRLYASMVREGVKVYIYNPLHYVVLNPRFNPFVRLHEKALLTYSADRQHVELLGGGRNNSEHYRYHEHTYDVETLMRFDREQGDKVYHRQVDELLQEKETVPFSLHFFQSDTGHKRFMKNMEQAYRRMKDASYSYVVAHNLETPQFKQVETAWFLQNRKTTDATRNIRYLISQAQKRVVVANAYLIPNNAYRYTFQDLQRRGVETYLFTNSEVSTEKSFVVTTMKYVVQEFKHEGPRVLLRLKGELHAKTTSIDEKVLIVSSVNKDGRSEAYNFENAWVLWSQPLAQQFETHLFEQYQEGEYSLYKGLLSKWDYCKGALLARVQRHL